MSDDTREAIGRRVQQWFGPVVPDSMLGQALSFIDEAAELRAAAPVLLSGYQQRIADAVYSALKDPDTEMGSAEAIARFIREWDLRAALGSTKPGGE